ncbi:MAG: hypothetical protein ACI9VR_001390 [Cognaticolwellia sp.]|jgi:hypothetical protein
MRIRSLTALALSLSLLACQPDDVDSTTDDTAETTDTSDTADTADTGEEEAARIVGDWLSEGEDVSVLLGYFSVVKVEASFNDDGTYTVISTDTEGAPTTYSGTYAADNSTDPQGIVVTQIQPQDGVSRGIFDVDGTTMQYEVVQDGLGYTAPTPESGFGSTSGTGLTEGDNVQVFQVQ